LVSWKKGGEDILHEEGGGEYKEQRKRKRGERRKAGIYAGLRSRGGGKDPKLAQSVGKKCGRLYARGRRSGDQEEKRGEDFASEKVFTPEKSGGGRKIALEGKERDFALNS